jgi:Uma2 family endonuclease
MDEYISNGSQLGWLIDPLERKVYVYRPGAIPQVLNDPKRSF